MIDIALALLAIGLIFLLVYALDGNTAGLIAAQGQIIAAHLELQRVPHRCYLLQRHLGMRRKPHIEQMMAQRTTAVHPRDERSLSRL